MNHMDKAVIQCDRDLLPCLAVDVALIKQRPVWLRQTALRVPRPTSPCVPAPREDTAGSGADRMPASKFELVLSAQLVV